MTDILFIYVTCADREEAQKISTALVEGRLVACANVMVPHQSIYWWEGKVQSGEEVAVILKTCAELFDKVEAVIQELHSYDCPCIVALPVEKGYAPFLNWIEQETKL